MSDWSYMPKCSFVDKILLPAALPPNPEQHLGREQQHHHLPCAHRHHVQLYEMQPASASSSGRSPSSQWSHHYRHLMFQAVPANWSELVPEHTATVDHD